MTDPRIAAESRKLTEQRTSLLRETVERRRHTNPNPPVISELVENLGKLRKYLLSVDEDEAAELVTQTASTIQRLLESDERMREALTDIAGPSGCDNADQALLRVKNLARTTLSEVTGDK